MSENNNTDNLQAVENEEDTAVTEGTQSSTDEAEEETREDVFNAIKHSAGFIRRELARLVDLRKVPFLTFYLDDSYNYGQKIEETISKINQDRK